MEQKKEAVYLINDERYLHLRENGAGVGFATYNKVTGEPLESGQISEKNLPPDGRNAISAARNWYLFELSDDDRKVIQQESVKILENIPQAGIGRRRIWEPETLPKDIRLINSHYDDLYRIPDGGVIQVDYPDRRSFTARVEHLDDYHFDMLKKIVLFPISLFVAFLALMARWLLTLSSYVVAPLMLYIFGCGIYTVYRQTWNQFFILLVAEFICFILFFGATAITEGIGRFSEWLAEL